MSKYRIAYKKGSRPAALGPAPRAIKKKPRKMKLGRYSLTKPMKGLVQSLIDSGKQDHWGIVTRSQSVLPYNAPVVANLISLVPQINQVGYDNGLITADIVTDSLNSREGKITKAKSLTGRYTFYVNPAVTQSGAHQALYLRVLTLSSKKFRSWKEVQDNWASGEIIKDKLFLNNKTQPMSWPGRPDYKDHPVNRSSFTVHQDQRFLMTRGAIIQRNTLTLPDEYTVESPMGCMYKQVNLRVKCKNAIIRYDADSDIYPTNFAPFAVAMYCTFSGNNSSAVDNTLNCHGSAKFIFEDE